MVEKIDGGFARSGYEGVTAMNVSGAGGGNVFRGRPRPRLGSGTAVVRLASITVNLNIQHTCLRFRMRQILSRAPSWTVG